MVFATSIAEEGVDISACNLVVRYCYARDEIAKLQSSGRARAQNAEEILLIDSKTEWLAEKEMTNEKRIDIMREAIDDVVKMISDDKDKFDAVVNTFSFFD